MIEKILEEVNIPYKLIDKDKSFKLIKMNSKLHILYLHSHGNKFILDRDLYDYINENSIPYSILCHNEFNNKLYFLMLNKNFNWVKSCFETCNKNSIYLGKNILSELISIDSLKQKLLKFN